MIKEIYSKVDESVLLATVLDKGSLGSYRTDMCPPEEFLQASGRYLKKGTFVAPHKHTKIIRNTDLTQEAWVVLQGAVKAKLYDLDDKPIEDVYMSSGSCIVFLRAGHSLEVLEDDTIFYEFKNGPYHGSKNDKKEILSEDPRPHQE
jgi:cupin fold WbuC family metalloprotein